MIFEQLRIGGDRNFAYLIGDGASGEGAAVDVGYNPKRVIERASEIGLTLRWIFATHSHYDHVDAIPELREATGARYAAFNTVSSIDRPLSDGDELELGAVRIRVMHCPGHSDDSIALLLDRTKCLTGDELFVGKIGGTATEAMARQQHESLHSKLMSLDDRVEVWPGHDFGLTPTSTIGAERQANPFLLQPTFEDFWHLKRHWAQYKKEHGIA
jgi:hydroxyacylglutathione hydrolase